MNVRSIRATLIALSLCGSCGSSHADNLIGQVSVIDGDTIEMHGMRIRFWGIDAPESSQLCRDQHGNEYRCGAQAANNLDAFIAQRPVNCAPLNVDRYGRTVGVCSVAGADLGDWLARNGLALDWPRYSKGKYRAAQKQAEQAKLGIWKGSYVEPWMSRLHRSGRPIRRLFRQWEYPSGGRTLTRILPAEGKCDAGQLKTHQRSRSY